MDGLTRASPSVEAAVLAGRERRFSPWREAWRRFRRHRLAAMSVVVLALLALAIVIGPSLWGVAINDIDFTARLSPPSWDHPFGTDDLGQDLLARMLYGGRISLAVGFAAMAVAMFFGTVVGAVAGISRGSVDAVLMWLADLFLSLPQLPLLLLVMYLFRDTLKGLVGPEGGVFILIVLVIGTFRWMPVARLVRAQFFSLREKEFVEAARMTGASDWRIMRTHLLPHLVAPIIVYSSLLIAVNILAEAGLSFLGLGIALPTPSWGNLLATAPGYYQSQVWILVFPGLAILFTTIAFNLLGDGLRDAFDPRSQL
jgi:peptide/nickel transport system permease protein